MGASEDLKSAVGFLTPLGDGSHQPTPEAMNWFPLVGAGIGALTAMSASICSRRLPPLAAGIAGALTDALLTGTLHLDGLADTADGLLAHGSDKSRLSIMAEPEVGTFGTLAVVFEILAKSASLGSGEIPIGVAAGLYGLSRSLMVLGARALPYARSEGLASAFVSSTDAPRGLAIGILGVAASVSLCALTGGRKRALAAVVGGLAGAGVLELGRRRLGGFTGDVLGASGCVCEGVGLVLALVSRADA